jgi:hypothetical protein
MQPLFLSISIESLSCSFNRRNLFLDVSGSPGDEADFRLMRDIAHSLKSVQLLEWSGQEFYRSLRKRV